MPAIYEKCAGLAKNRGVKMNKPMKSKVKPVGDIFMTVLLLFLMGYQFWGETAHEWAGTLMLLLFIAHHILNAGWYKNIFRGRYTPIRIIMTVINLALLVTMLCLMGSGIMMSRHVFSFLSVSSGMGTARLVHMAACYWGFVLMSLHLGLHWGMMMTKMRQSLPSTGPSRIRTVILRIVAAVIAVHGAYVFISRNLITYMLLQTQFVFLDFGESPISFYIDYLAMAGLFVWIVYYLTMIFRRKKKEYRKAD